MEELEETIKQYVAKQKLKALVISIVACGAFFGSIRYMEYLARGSAAERYAAKIEEQLPKKTTSPITIPAVCASEVHTEGSGLDAILYCRDDRDRKLSCRKEKGTTICYTLADKVTQE